jgi:hypothetical protein
MEWKKMMREHQHIRHLGSRIYEVIDIQKGLTRQDDEVFFVTNIEYDLDSYSTDCLFDYVRLFGYSSLEDVNAQHPDIPDMYIVEAIATVTASFNRDNDPAFESIEEAFDHINRRWLNKKEKRSSIHGPSLEDLLQSTYVRPTWFNDDR